MVPGHFEYEYEYEYEYRFTEYEYETESRMCVKSGPEGPTYPKTLD